PEYLTAYLRCVNNETLRDNLENKCAELIDLNKAKLKECENGNEGITMLAENSIYSRSMKIGSEIAVMIHNNLLLQNFDINTVFKQLEGN
ncbi:MAG: hypothetical protein JW737_02420, partial [Acidobacteria bacterium]|nr:hypothetical protein [Acidobacteriota bacterium]